MFNEKKLWKLQIYAERTWRLAMDIAMEASKLEKNGYVLARVAEETRYVANKLYSGIEAIKNGGSIDGEFYYTLEKLNLVAQNGCIEMLRLKQYADYGNNTIGLAVIMDEIRNLAYELMKLFDYKEIRTMKQIEITCFSKVTNLGLFLLQATIGDKTFIENVQYVDEIIMYDERDSSLFDSKGEFMNLRGNKIPVINLYKKLNYKKANTSKKYAVIMNTDWKEPNRFFVVLIDELASNSIFKSRLGINSQYKSNLYPAEFVREAWQTADNEQVVFLDWVKLSQ
jgi:chemotaxis signal transduction protein